MPRRRSTRGSEDINDDFAKLQADLEQAWKIRLPWSKETYIPFFSHRIKKIWSPWRANLEFYNNWIALLVTLGTLMVPGDALGLEIIGGISLFVGNMLTHYWYGYNRYSNVSKRWFESRLKLRENINNRNNNQRPSVASRRMEAIRDRMAHLYHGSPVTNESYEETDTKIRCWGSPVILLNEIVVLLFCSMFALSILIAYLGVVFNMAGDPSSSTCLFRFLLSVSTCIVSLAMFTGGHLGSLLGSLWWSILYVGFDNADSESGISNTVATLMKLLAGLVMLLTEEYYTALLFRKTFGDFLESILMGVFKDVFSTSEIFNFCHDVIGEVDHVQTDTTNNNAGHGNQAQPATATPNNNNTNTSNARPNVAAGSASGKGDEIGSLFARAIVKELRPVPHRGKVVVDEPGETAHTEEDGDHDDGFDC